MHVLNPLQRCIGDLYAAGRTIRLDFVALDLAHDLGRILYESDTKSTAVGLGAYGIPHRTGPIAWNRPDLDYPLPGP
jgi:hypothetical protein